MSTPEIASPSPTHRRGADDPLERNSGRVAAAQPYPGFGCCPPSSCGGQGLWGWSPPLLVADTPLKRGVDRLLPRTGVPALLYFAVVIALLNVAPHIPRRPELAVDGIAALIGGGWCALNFWRCRHAHCLITGVGWLTLSLFVFAEAALGRSLIAGDEQLIFVGILGAGLAFEAMWFRFRGSNAVAGFRASP